MPAAIAPPSTPVTRRSLLMRWRQPGWPLFAALMILLGLYLGVNARIGLRFATGIAAWEPYLWELSSALVVGALIPGIVLFERRFRLDAKPRGRTILAHLAGAIVFSAVHVIAMVALRKAGYALMGESYDFGNVLIGGFYELQKDALTYLIVLLAVFAVREFRIRRVGQLQAAELAAELSEARLRHLTAQVDPHFLFNALNTISNRMHEDVDAADRMIRQLGDLLRAAYADDQHVLVPLRGELDWLCSYAAMMTERFRGQLTFELDAESGLDELRVPRLLLQPIVENAFRHGLADGHGGLWVTVRRVDQRLHYRISDDGVGVPEQPVGRGTGLTNVARRLELLFPDDHTLSVAAREPRGTVVSVAFPVTP